MPEIPTEAFDIFARGLDHPDGLAFDCNGDLWAGGEAGQLYRIDPSGRTEIVADLGGFCVWMAFSPAVDLHVCVTGRGVVRVGRSGPPVLFADEVSGRALVCPNFPVFDSRGLLYMSDSGQWQKNDGALVRFTPDG